MTQRGPSTPDCTAVLQALREGATFMRVEGELGALHVGTEVCRLWLERDTWKLDPFAGCLIDRDTHEALVSWASSHEPATTLGGDVFAPALVPAGNVGRMPVAHVRLMRASAVAVTA